MYIISNTVIQKIRIQEINGNICRSRIMPFSSQYYCEILLLEWRRAYCVRFQQNILKSLLYRLKTFLRISLVGTIKFSEKSSRQREMSNIFSQIVSIPKYSSKSLHLYWAHRGISRNSEAEELSKDPTQVQESHFKN